MTALLPSIQLDAPVLQFQNQKLMQKLEVQKVEYLVLENKLHRLKERQQSFEPSLEVVIKSWAMLLDDLESCSFRIRDIEKGRLDGPHTLISNDCSSSLLGDQLLSGLINTGVKCCPNEMQQNEHTYGATQAIFRKLVGAMDDLWYLKDKIHAFVLKAVQNDVESSWKASCDLETMVKNLRSVLVELHLKHKSLSGEVQNYRDADAKNIAVLRHLREEVETSVTELDESNCKLSTLKGEMYKSRGGQFPVINSGSKHTPVERTREKPKKFQDTEFALEELLEQASSRLVELKGLHEERLGILKQLSASQNTLKSVSCISTSEAFLLVQDELANSKSQVAHYQVLFEKLQVERDNLLWREKYLNVKNELIEAFQRSFAVADVRINELAMEVQKQLDHRNLIEAKLDVVPKEAGRQEIITKYKALISSLPGSMGAMQDQLRSYKEASADIHALRANMQSLSNVLDRKTEELKKLSAISAERVAEIKKLQAFVESLKQDESELKLIFEMFLRESTDSRDVMEAKNLEMNAWGHVQCLRTSLDDQTLELRVKTANEAEAKSQQRLAVAEAEIADLRKKLEACERDVVRLTDLLKSNKHEENEAYLSEIETIGQAYDDMQNQNQQLLQQITERDDYNIKLYLEGVRARQLEEVLVIEKLSMEKQINQANISLDLFNIKASKVEDQLKVCEDHIQKLAEERLQNVVTLENMQKKLLDVQTLCQQSRKNLDGFESQVVQGRVNCAELRIELEKERFEKKRIKEELEAARKKLSRLRAQTDGSSVVGKLQRELKEYKDLLRCGICLDRPKEVVITRCYHLFCYCCVQKILETRHRKCAVCSSSFGPNDVKSVYI